MKASMKLRGTTLAFLAFLSLGTVGITAKVGDVGRIYSRLERAFYLDPQDDPFIRPGLHIKIQNVSIPPDRQPVVVFQLTDNGSQPLDRTGVSTPGVVASSFIMAYLPRSASQYVNYSTRKQSSPNQSPCTIRMPVKRPGGRSVPEHPPISELRTPGISSPHHSRFWSEDLGPRVPVFAGLWRCY